MKRITMSALFLLLIHAPLWAAVEYQIETTSYIGAEPTAETEVTVIEGERLRMDDGDTTVIYHGDSGEIVVVDHSEETYMVIDKEALQQIAGKVSRAMQEMQEQLKTMPPEQREMVERIMKEKLDGYPGAVAAKPQRAVNANSERKEQHGYSTARYDVLEGGKKVQELWVANWSDVRGGEAMQRIALDMATFFESLVSSVRQSIDSPAIFSAGAFYGSLSEIKGFPIVTRLFDGDALTYESIVKSVTEKKLEPAYFAPPSGYKKQEMTQAIQ